MEIYSIRPLLAILVSAAAAVLILFSRNHRDLREGWTFLAAGLKWGLIASLFPMIKAGYTVVFPFFDLFEGVPILLKVDALGFYFALLASSLWIITSIYSVGYMRSLSEHEQTRYFFAFSLSLSATVGIAFAGDLVTFFIFFELLTIATYPLVAHKETPEAIAGGRKYLVYSLSAAALLLFAVAWTYQLTGSTSFTPGGIGFEGLPSKILLPLFFLFLYGVSVKAALFPMHAWLPTAMVAPTPVSALLHAVAVVKAGAFGVLRVVGYVFGPEILNSSNLAAIAAGLAGFTILYASIFALTEDNLKRRLAYSTIGQLSYIILGAFLISPDAFLGSVLHLANHAMLKITLFFCAGVIYVKTHKEKISDMQGIAYQLPWTFTAFTIGVLGLSGFPPFSGFISKWFLCKGAISSGHWPALFIYLFSALLNAAYLFPVIITAFKKPGRNISRNERPWTLSMPPIATALLSICFGAIPMLFSQQIQLASMAVAGIFKLR